jgi:hypothetical protein
MDAGTQTERVVHVLDGTLALTESNAHLLAQVAPLFASARSCGSAPVLDAPSEFVVRALALARAFMEWDEQDGEVKERQRTRVAKMVARIRGCPFNAQFADALGMHYTLPQMEARLRESAESAAQCESAAQGESAARGARPELTEHEMRRYFGTFPAGPVCFSLEVCVLIVALKRTSGMVISFEHHEIDGTAYIGETRIVRGRNSPHGCAVQSATLAVGLRAQANVRLSYFEGESDDEGRKWQLVETSPTHVIESLRAHHDALAAPGKGYDETRLAGIVLELATMIGTLA